MTAAGSPGILNVHTPTTSFAIVHSLTQESLLDLHDKLSRKSGTGYTGQRIGAGWLKYEFNDTVWNLDDDADYTIFAWRQQQPPSPADAPSTSASTSASTSTANNHIAEPPIPTLHLHDPHAALPTPPAYRNPAYYVFHPARAHHHHASASSDGGRTGSPGSHARSSRSRRTKGSKRGKDGKGDAADAVPAFKRAFDKFHSENGVRTVLGSIGPVSNVRMLLKAGYRHVYISRKFAQQHGFIPKDAAPGLYGYSGLVNIGTWPITLTPAATSGGYAAHPDAPPPPPPKPRYSVAGTGKPPKKGSRADDGKPKPTLVTVYLSEEPHFDVVLGRSFFEKRQIQVSTVDPTEVVCMDTGEKLECELVILKDGRGEIVTVT